MHDIEHILINKDDPAYHQILGNHQPLAHYLLQYFDKTFRKYSISVKTTSKYLKKTNLLNHIFVCKGDI